MKKGLKYTLVSLGSLVVLAGIGLGIMYVVSPYKVKRWGASFHLILMSSLID